MGCRRRRRRPYSPPRLSVLGPPSFPLLAVCPRSTANEWRQSRRSKVVWLNSSHLAFRACVCVACLCVSIPNLLFLPLAATCTTHIYPRSLDSLQYMSTEQTISLRRPATERIEFHCHLQPPPTTRTPSALISLSLPRWSPIPLSLCSSQRSLLAWLPCLDLCYTPSPNFYPCQILATEFSIEG